MTGRLNCMLLLGLLATPALAMEAPPTYSAAAVREDFEQLYRTLQAAHVNLYVATPKAAYDSAFDRRVQQFTSPMTRTEVIREFQRFLALGQVAHARVEDSGEAFQEHVAAGGRYLPLYIRARGDRAWISDDYSGTGRVQAGDEILRLGGQATAELLSTLRQELSADTRYLANTLLETQFPRLLWETRGSPDHFELIVAGKDGRERQVALPTLTREQVRGNTASAENGGLELSWTGREARILDDGIAYLRPGPFYNVEGGDALWDTAAFQTFIDDAFMRFREAGAKQLLIDLRNNPGGDSSFSDLLVAWIADRPFRFCSDFQVKVSEATTASNAERLPASDPGSVSHAYAREFDKRKPGELFSFPIPLVQPRPGERYDGEVYALVNRHSYSNAVTVAAILQDYGLATILGEETADLASTLGAMEHFELAKTGIRIGYPKARIIRPSGDATRRGVVPDSLIETPIVESRDDPVLREALARIRENGKG